MSKWYVVSEEELERLYSAGRSDGMSSGSDGWYESDDERSEQASAACRARVVPEWATHVAFQQIEGRSLIKTQRIKVKK